MEDEKEPIQRIQEWVGKEKYTIIFDSEHHELTSRMFWSCLKGRKDILIVIETDEGYIFGSYHSIIPERQELCVENDPHHFVFTMKNPFNVPPTKFELKEGWKKSLYIYGDDQISDVFYVFGCYLICNNDESFIKKIFNYNYRHKHSVDAHVFVGKLWDSYFSLSRLVCVQFFD